MAMLKIIYVVLFVNVVNCYPECCPHDNILEEWKYCSDNVTKLNLNCPNKAYLIRNETEMFHVNDDDESLVFDIKSAPPISKDNYCIAHLARRHADTFHKVALICFAEQKFSYRAYHSILGLVSVVFFILTFIVYLILPELRDLQGKILMVSVFFFIIGYSCLVILQVPVHMDNISCTVIGHVLYVSLLIAFCWMNIVAFNVWRSVVLPRKNFNETTLAVAYMSWGFGIPTLMLFITLLIQHIPGDHKKPGIGTIKCWFSSDEHSWYLFYGPLSLFLLLNVIMFVWIIWNLSRAPAGGTNNKMQSLRFKCWLYLKLFLIMGVSWVFEIISFAFDGNFGPWYITDVLNLSQGVISFLILVVFRKRVRQALAKNKTCGINWPQRWKNGPDDESHTVVDEEVDMSLTKIDSRL